MLAVVLLGLSLPAQAVQPDEILSDPALESRARDISAGLRCLVCQNQSIDDSDAPLARDLRLLVRERLEAGDTDAEVREFLVARYGDFVLLRPPLKPSTLVLWVMPVLALLLAAWAAARVFRRPPAGEAPGPVPLSGEEEERLRGLLASEPEDAGEKPGR